MNYLFIFDIFNSHIYVSFCSNDAEGIKSTVVPEGHFAVSWATYHCKLHFSLLHSPQTLGHTHFPLPKFSFCNSTCNISPSLRKRWKEKRWSTCRGVVWKPCHALHQLSPCPVAPSLPHSMPPVLGRRQEQPSAGTGSPASPGLRSLSCLKSWLATETTLMGGCFESGMGHVIVIPAKRNAMCLYWDTQAHVPKMIWSESKARNIP